MGKKSADLTGKRDSLSFEREIRSNFNSVQKLQHSTRCLLFVYVLGVLIFFSHVSNCFNVVAYQTELCKQASRDFRLVVNATVIHQKLVESIWVGQLDDATYARRIRKLAGKLNRIVHMLRPNLRRKLFPTWKISYRLSLRALNHSYADAYLLLHTQTNMSKLLNTTVSDTYKSSIRQLETLHESIRQIPVTVSWWLSVVLMFCALSVYSVKNWSKDVCSNEMEHTTIVKPLILSVLMPILVCLPALFQVWLQTTQLDSVILSVHNEHEVGSMFLNYTVLKSLAKISVHTIQQEWSNHFFELYNLVLKELSDTSSMSSFLKSTKKSRITLISYWLQAVYMVTPDVNTMDSYFTVQFHQDPDLLKAERTQADSYLNCEDQKWYWKSWQTTYESEIHKLHGLQDSSVHSIRSSLTVGGYYYLIVLFMFCCISWNCAKKLSHVESNHSLEVRSQLWDMARIMTTEEVKVLLTIHVKEQEYERNLLGSYELIRDVTFSKSSLKELVDFLTRTRIREREPRIESILKKIYKDNVWKSTDWQTKLRPPFKELCSVLEKEIEDKIRTVFLQSSLFSEFYDRYVCEIDEKFSLDSSFIF